MVHEKLIPLLLGALVMFASSLKTGVVLGRGESLTAPEVLILEDFQCATGLDSWKCRKEHTTSPLHGNGHQVA